MISIATLIEQLLYNRAFSLTNTVYLHSNETAFF